MIIYKPRGLATNTTIDMETKPSEMQFENGSDHAVVGSYLELCEEGEVKYINGPPTLPVFTWKCVCVPEETKGWVILLVSKQVS